MVMEKLVLETDATVSVPVVSVRHGFHHCQVGIARVTIDDNVHVAARWPDLSLSVLLARR